MTLSVLQSQIPTARLASRFAFVALPFFALACCGCEGVRYVAHLLEGQLAIQMNIEPIERVLDSGRLSATDAAKLRLITAARQFAIDRIGLNAGQSYTTFHDTQGKPLVYNLSASRKDRLEPFQWSFPILGSFPYLGFFKEDYLNEEESRLVADGYDTYVYQPDAYSTLGILADPVRSPMLRRDEISLVDTIIHEVLHNTIWRANDIPFNETMATFVGHTGTIEFFGEQTDPALQLADAARARFADDARLNQFLVEVYASLEAYYGQPLSTEAKIAGREAVFEAQRQRFRREVQPLMSRPAAYAFYATMPANNAFMLLFARYNFSLEVFERVHEANGREWPKTLDVLRDAARTHGDPMEYLESWLAQHTPAAAAPRDNAQE